MRNQIGCWLSPAPAHNVLDHLCLGRHEQEPGDQRIMITDLVGVLGIDTNDVERPRHRGLD